MNNKKLKYKNLVFIIIFLIVLSLALISIKICFDFISKEFYISKCKVIKNVIKEKVDNQLSYTEHYSLLDNIFNFLDKNDIKYIESNINDEFLKNLNIDFIIFFNKYKKFYYAYFLKKGNDLGNKENIFILQLTNKFYPYLSEGKKLIKLKTFTKIYNNLYLLTFHPILKSSKIKLAYGTLIFGKTINNNFFDKIGKTVNCKLSILNYTSHIKKIILNDNSAIIPFFDYNKNTIFLVKAVFPENKFLFYLEVSIYIFVFIMISFTFITLLYFSKKEKTKIKGELSLLNKAINQSKTGVLLTGFDGKIYYVNDILCKIAGFNKEELIGDYAIKLMDKEALEDIFNNKLKNQKFWRGEISGKTKNGEKIDLEVNISPVVGENGKIEAFVSTCEFISDKKRLINDLEKSKKEAESINKLKTAVLMNLSHETKTPLTGILGFINLLKSTDLSNKQKEYIEHLESSAEKLMNLFDRLIELSKIETNLYSLKVSPFNIYQLNQKLTDKFKILANKKGLFFKYEIDKKIPEIVIGCENLLEKALTLILENAIKFTEKGEIIFDCKLIEFSENEIKVCFRIKDTGIGISKKDLKNILELFIQTDTSTSRKFEGLGVGLTLAKKIIDAINGEIFIDSELGKGSEFRIVVKLNVA